MPHHLHDVPDGAGPAPVEGPAGTQAPDGFWVWGDPEDDWDDATWEPLVRPAWWRWVAIAVIVALMVATPLAYGVYWIIR